MSKKHTVSDEQRIFKLFHEYYNVYDFTGRKSIRPDATIAWATGSKLKRGHVQDIVYDEDLDSFFLVLDSCNRIRRVDPKRCIVLHG